MTILADKLPTKEFPYAFSTSLSRTASISCNTAARVEASIIPTISIITIQNVLLALGVTFSIKVLTLGSSCVLAVSDPSASPCEVDIYLSPYLSNHPNNLSRLVLLLRVLIYCIVSNFVMWRIDIPRPRGS